jgi:hypothetical protein
MTTGVGLYRSSDGGDHWERLTGEEFRVAYPDHMMLSPDEKILFMSGAKFHPGFWMGTHVADTMIGRSRDHGRSWDTEPKGFAVAPRANIEALTMACWPGGYELFVGDTEHRAYERGWRRQLDPHRRRGRLRHQGQPRRSPPRRDPAPRRCGGALRSSKTLSTLQGGEKGVSACVELHLNRRHALERNPRFKYSNRCT